MTVIPFGSFVCVYGIPTSAADADADVNAKAVARGSQLFMGPVLTRGATAM